MVAGMTPSRNAPPVQAAARVPTGVAAKRSSRVRLDQALVERGLAPTRERARALVLAREVEVDGEVARRAAAPVGDASELRVRSGRRRRLRRCRAR